MTPDPGGDLKIEAEREKKNCAAKKKTFNKKLSLTPFLTASLLGSMQIR